jgi:hypothetical protein
MSPSRALFVLANLTAATTVVGAQLSTAPPQGDQLPPKVIVDILDAAPTPTVIVAPNRQMAAILERKSMPSIADLAEPIHRLAGARINPRTNGRQLRTGAGIGITLKNIADGAERKVAIPAGVNAGGLSFSPNGRYLAFTNTKPAASELWIADTATGQARVVSGGDRLNGAAGEP